MAGLSLLLAVVVGLAARSAVRPATYHAALGSSREPQVPARDAAALLRGLVTAVGRDDPSAAAGLGASAQVGRDLAGVVRNGKALHVSGFALRYVDEAADEAPDGSWTGLVAATWRFAGFDTRPVRMEVRVRFAPHDGRLAIAGVGGGGGRTPVWLTGPVQVRRSLGALVLVQGSAARADRMAALAAAAVSQTREVLPSWAGHLVLEEPGSQRALEAALESAHGQYAGIAAITTSVDGSRDRGAALHVFVNPRVFDPLSGRGAQVVLTHEATHVATGAATSPAPIWLVEGFADYVALHAQRIPLATSAARLAALVRRTGPPARLPGKSAFTASAPRLEAHYEGAWLACRLLARRRGPAALVAFYDAVDGGRAVGPALRRAYGFGLAGLTGRWRTLLSHLPA